MEQITSVEFWNEVESIADNILDGDYSSEAVGAIREKISDLENLIEEKTYPDIEDERKEEIDEEIEALENDIETDIEDLDLDAINDDIYSLVHEQVDSHAWVIYTYQAWQVAQLMSSDDNACSEFEELCCIKNGKSLDDLIIQFAFCALNSNVMAELDNALERLKEKLTKEYQEAKK